MWKTGSRRIWRFVASVAVLFAATPALAAVNIEFRPASQTIVNGQNADIGVYAVSDSGSNQQFGRIVVEFSYDSSALQLMGVVNNGPFTWNSSGIISSTPPNAVYAAVAPFTPPFAMATPSGLLVATLRFKGIDTVTNAPVTILDTANTEVVDHPVSGNDITGTLGPPVTVTVVCNVNADCNDNNPCTSDTCSGQVCSHGNLVAGTACGSSANTACDNPDTCNGSGTCLPNFEPPGTACGSSANTDCDNPDTCNGSGTCLSNFEPAGTACGNPADTDCNNPDSCNASGTCLNNFEPAGTACGSPSDTECDNPDSCNASGTCQPNFATAGTACGEPGDDACGDPDSCDGSGACDPNDTHSCPAPTPFCRDKGGEAVCVECLPGDNTPCNDGIFCTADFCAFPGNCLNSGDPMNGTPCLDSVFCNGPEACQGGVCTSPGNPCNDQNPCTSNVCTEATDTCTFPPDNNANPDDGLFCNGTDTCMNGMVIEGEPPTCDDMKQCTEDECDPNTDECIHTPIIALCDDGNPCTIGDQCNGMNCMPGPPPPSGTKVDLLWSPAVTTVAVGDQFTLGLRVVSKNATPDEFGAMQTILNWNPAKMTLVGASGGFNWSPQFPIFPDDSQQDGLNNTWNDGNALFAGTAALGNLPMAGPSPGLLAKNFQFVAQQTGTATMLTIPLCVGQTPTTTFVIGTGGGEGAIQDIRGSATINIVQCLNAADCTDGLFCNGAETCVNNMCVAGTNPCNDMNVCTNDICTESNDTCSHTPNNNANPDDGLFCNGTDTCQGGVIVPGTPPVCNDNNICTNDSCSNPMAMCVFQPNSNSCSDGDPCTGPDICVGGACDSDPIPDCVNCEDDLECDDEIDCTVDSCSPQGACVYVPDNGMCPDNGVFCDGDELCDPMQGDPVTGCFSTGPPCVGCTEETGCSCGIPTVMAMGGKYIAISPTPSDTAVPTRFQISMCGGTMTKWVGPLTGQSTAIPFDIDPVPGFPEPDGTVARLVDTIGQSLRLTGTQWMGTVYVTGPNITPSTTYEVRADCGPIGSPNLTPPVMVTTGIWADTRVPLNQVVNLDDAFADVLAIEGNYTNVTVAHGDIEPCTPNRVINLADVLLIVLRIEGGNYSDLCPLPCGP